MTLFPYKRTYFNELNKEENREKRQRTHNEMKLIFFLIASQCWFIINANQVELNPFHWRYDEPFVLFYDEADHQFYLFFVHIWMSQFLALVCSAQCVRVRRREEMYY